MHCSSCGATTADGAAFCGSCGRPIVGYSVAQAAVAPAGGVAGAVPGVAAAGARAYAGFWLRFVAYVIDSLLLGAVLVVVFAIVVGFIGLGTIRSQFEEFGRTANQANPVFPVFVVTLIFVAIICGAVAGWLYFAAMESSENQGTLGKMALGLVVTDITGRPVTFGRATGRFFAKIITSLVPLYIGYIMAGFTEKKQALHDMIASCLVLRKA